MAAGEARDGFEVNGVAHVILRVNRNAECIAFYDQVMPFLGLKAVPPRAHDVGGGRLVATVTDPDGNVLGLIQDP